MTTNKSALDKELKSDLIGDIFVNIGENVKSVENKTDMAMNLIDNVCEWIGNSFVKNQADREIYGRLIKGVGGKIKQGERNIETILLSTLIDGVMHVSQSTKTNSEGIDKSI